MSVDAWTRTALRAPLAHGAPLPGGGFKASPEDFRVDEQLSFEPSGSGPHWLLRVEKRAANTRWVAAELARLAQVPTVEVGYAGLKDRQAVASQWFSVPARASTAEFWAAAHTAEFRVLEVCANARKLKRGALSGNRFTIRLRKTTWPRGDLEQKLAALRTHGVPNYFGPQRFGRDADNLDRVQTWIESGHPPRGRALRGFALSAARSLLFNAVLARRVEAGGWSQLAPGDVASLDGSASFFTVRELDGELQSRLAAFDLHPSGPLWGRGEPPTAGEVLRLELDTALQFKDVAALLAGEGLVQERRALRCAVRDLEVETDAGVVTLSFALGRGQYATAVLREICDLESSEVLDPDED